MQSSGIRWWSSRTHALGGGQIEARASGGAQVEVQASCGDSAEVQALGGGPTELRASSGGTAEIESSYGGLTEFSWKVPWDGQTGSLALYALPHVFLYGWFFKLIRSRFLLVVDVLGYDVARVRFLLSWLMATFGVNLLLPWLVGFAFPRRPSPFLCCRFRLDYFARTRVWIVTKESFFSSFDDDIVPLRFEVTAEVTIFLL
ncbi:hypothetical protein KFK09_016374 [Dendrobium nobile]|uniref:Uncharacterized protein n=1 Tax=Dendrobium nobile TaxID=94219 RepID=A0A8T3AYI9_DENNO|nr:hypothetical protein KFK09_016374 [Dendrobium nobile]